MKGKQISPAQSNKRSEGRDSSLLSLLCMGDSWAHRYAEMESKIFGTSSFDGPPFHKVKSKSLKPRKKLFNILQYKENICEAFYPLSSKTRYYD